ncbi:MAG TPA: AAA family ATPase [Anaerohalosphaeraceae bacterium]|nr:AAA family ATPase [Anaerohalosphaeraceae bacterium]
MYLKRLRIWNFRSIGSNNNEPGLDIEFDERINLLIGANDSGKTAIIDAIRYCLGTQTYDPIRIDVEDFYQKPVDQKSEKEKSEKEKERANEFKIECTFSGFTPKEAGQFLEWISIDKSNGAFNAELKVWFTAVNKNNRITTYLRAGADEEGLSIEGEPRDLLRVTYLKPLRDAENEFIPGYRSRLYQILRSHPVFEKENVNQKHPLEKYFKQAEDFVISFFEKEQLDSNPKLEITGEEKGGKCIKEVFETQTKIFLESYDNREPKIKIAPVELNAILRKLELILEENKAGLGTLNLLYMAAELIHLKREEHLGLRLALIEELEAHLHPQAQLRVLKSLLAERSSRVQYIFTTHSTILGSSIPLKHLYLCLKDNANDHIQVRVFPLNSQSTQLSETDYHFLERFLDATKANLFFAKGILIIEGDAENILLPALAEIIGRPLHKYGVSIVNVGSKALLRYVRIFQQKNGQCISIRTAVITDSDIPVKENGMPENGYNVNKHRQNIAQKYDSGDGRIQAFVSPLKTMEFDIAMGNLYQYMYKAIQIAKKIKSTDDWIADKELRNILNQSIEEKNPNKRAKIIYEPLEKNQASKPVAAQWFAKLLMDDKDRVSSLIREDYENNTGIRYLIEAIEHVTEKIKWDTYGNNR